MNREQRRHPEKLEHLQDETAQAAAEPPKDTEQEMREQSRPQDVLDPRAKNTGHKKHTADKWNQ